MMKAGLDTQKELYKDMHKPHTQYTWEGAL